MRKRTYRYAISKDSNGVVCEVKQLPLKLASPMNEMVYPHSYMKIIDEGSGSLDLGYIWIIALVFIGIMAIKTTT